MKQIKKIFRGVTLVEVIIGIFIFSIVVLATSEMFISSFSTKKLAQNTQKKYDSVFGALGEVGKIISTSKVMQANSTSMTGTQTIVVYSYSTPESECKKFIFDKINYRLLVREKNVPDGDSYMTCTDSFLTTGASMKVIVDKFITGKFVWRKLNTTTNPKLSGMVTIFAQAYASNPTATPKPTVLPMQTTVSLRDYLSE